MSKIQVERVEIIDGLISELDNLDLRSSDRKNKLYGYLIITKNLLTTLNLDNDDLYTNYTNKADKIIQSNPFHYEDCLSSKTLLMNILRSIRNHIIFQSTESSPIIYTNDKSNTPTVIIENISEIEKFTLNGDIIDQNRNLQFLNQLGEEISKSKNLDDLSKKDITNIIRELKNDKFILSATSGLFVMLIKKIIGLGIICHL